jgi:hypothetical protein
MSGHTLRESNSTEDQFVTGIAYISSFFFGNFLDFFMQHLIPLAKNMLLSLQSLDEVGENLMGLLSQAQGRSPRHAALTGIAPGYRDIQPSCTE